MPLRLTPAECIKAVSRSISRAIETGLNLLQPAHNLRMAAFQTLLGISTRKSPLTLSELG